MSKVLVLLMFLTGCTVQTQRTHLITPGEIRLIQDDLSSVQNQQIDNMWRLIELEEIISREVIYSRAIYSYTDDFLFSINKLMYSIETARSGSALWFNFQGEGDPLEGMGFPKELQF